MAIASWSGGKDSCLALYKAIQQGNKIECLLNFISKEHKRCCFHGIKGELMKLQAELMEIPIVQKEVTPDMKKYEEEFKEAVTGLKAKGAQKMVFGDIYLLEHATWVDRVCKDLKIEPLEPLWGKEPSKIVEEFIEAGFESIVVSAKADLFDGSFVGRYVDSDFLNYLKERKICPCGENGEFHTFVVNGPLFKNKIKITKAKPILREGFWRHWFLDIQDYEVA